MDVSKGRAGFGSETTGRLISETGAEGWACKSSTWQHNCLGGGAGTDLSDAPRVWGEGCCGNGRHVESENSREENKTLIFTYTRLV